VNDPSKSQKKFKLLTTEIEHQVVDANEHLDVALVKFTTGWRKNNFNLKSFFVAFLPKSKTCSKITATVFWLMQPSCFRRSWAITDTRRELKLSWESQF
jgi:hypothetical protein